MSKTFMERIKKIKLNFTGERIVPEASNCEPNFAKKMYQEHIARYLFASQFAKNKDVLDVGCGVGYGSLLLADKGAKSVDAFDINIDAIEHADIYYAHQSINYTVQNAKDFHFKKKFDLVTCFELIEHVERPEQVIKNIKTHLKKDGILVISTPRKLEENRSEFHAKEFHMNEFNHLLKKYFEYVEFFFENNHFVSYVTCSYPGKRKYDIKILEDVFSPVRCDYFIAIASDIKIDLAAITDTMVFNDDSYLKILERDVSILHRVEDSIREDLKRIEEELKDKADQVSNLELQISPFRKALSYIENWKCTKLGDRLFPIDSKRREFAKRIKSKLAGWSDTQYELKIYPSCPSKQGSVPLKKVAFLIGCLEGESKRYRVYNLIEGLTEKGVECAVFYDINIDKVEGLLDSDILVLFRTGLNEHVRTIIEKFRENKIPIVFDIDDLVFEPDVVYNVNAIKDWPEEQKEQYLEGVTMYRGSLEECDYATCPTEYLAGKIRAIGKKAYIVRNTINKAQIEHAKSHVKPEDDGKTKIGYFSGTNTHNRDFLEAIDAVYVVLKNFDNTELHIVGELAMEDRFTEFGSRVLRRKRMPYLEMLDYLSHMDINIAPLEQDNPYTSGKSELKIFEAALVGVPTIASNTNSYANCISDGVNGLIADSNQEWEKKLTQMVKDKGFRERLGAKAKEDFVKIFYIGNIVESLVNTYQAIIFDFHSKPIDLENLDIAWIIPEPFIGSGGHRNIFRTVRKLSEYGHKLTMYFTGILGINAIKEMVNKHFYDLSHLKFVKYEGRLSNHDICFATHWSTVYPMMQNREKIKYLFYFVQDYEPMFAPMSSEYILAENTYKLGLTHITSGPWPTAILRKKYSAEADFFQFPVDKVIYSKNIQRTKENKNILFFARPEMPRRCYDIGIMALKQVKERCPEIEIIIFGSKNIHSKSISFKHTNAGLLPTISDLANLYRNADLGIVFSTTNPSLVPYEMMACGLAVGDIRLDESVLNYGNEENVFLLNPMPEIMASEIESILSDDKERKRRAHNGHNYVINNFPDEEEMGRRIEKLIKRKILNGNL